MCIIKDTTLLEFSNNKIGVIFMQSATTLAMRELSDIRDDHALTLAAHKEELRSLTPEFAAIEANLIKSGHALLRNMLRGGNDFEKIKQFIRAEQTKKQKILKRFNLPSDYLDEKFNCAICHDKGFDENGLKCDCLKALISKYIVINSNLTDIMKNQTFENFDFSVFSSIPSTNSKRATAPIDLAHIIYNKALDFAKNFKNTEDGPKNILLKGNAGTGKTYLSSCIANEVLKNGNTVYYQTSYKLCEILENVKFGKYENQDDLNDASNTIKYMQKVDLLIIDDLGTEFLTQFTAAALFDLINTRLINNKSTIISTNLDFDSMNKLYSSRFSSRIIGEYLIISMAGDDLRKRRKFEI